MPDPSRAVRVRVRSEAGGCNGEDGPVCGTDHKGWDRKRVSRNGHRQRCPVLRHAASSPRIVGTLGRTSAVRGDLGEAASRRTTVQTTFKEMERWLSKVM